MTANEFDGENFQIVRYKSEQASRTRASKNSWEMGVNPEANLWDTGTERYSEC
jgi:hypothetical protein